MRLPTDLFTPHRVGIEWLRWVPGAGPVLWSRLAVQDRPPMHSQAPSCHPKATRLSFLSGHPPVTECERGSDDRMTASRPAAEQDPREREISKRSSESRAPRMHFSAWRSATTRWSCSAGLHVRRRGAGAL